MVGAVSPTVSAVAVLQHSFCRQVTGYRVNPRPDSFIASGAGTLAVPVDAVLQQ